MATKAPDNTEPIQDAPAMDVPEAKTVEVSPSIEELKPQRKKMWLLILAGIAVAVLGSYLAITLSKNTVSVGAQEVWGSVTTLDQIESGEINIEVVTTADEVQEIDAVALTGRALFDQEQAIVDVALTYGEGSYSAGIYYSEESSFIRLGSVDLIIANLLALDPLEPANSPIFDVFTPYENAWISLAASDLEELGLGETQDDIALDQAFEDIFTEIGNMIVRSDAIDAHRIDQTKMLGDAELIGYDLTIDPQKGATLLSDILEYTQGQQELAQFTDLDQDLTSIPDDFDDLTDGVTALQLWTDGTYLRQITIGERGSDIYINLELTQLNIPVEIEVPVAEFTFDEVVGDIFELFLGASGQ